MERVIWMNSKKTPNMGEAIKSNNCMQSQGGLWYEPIITTSWNLIKLLMICHSRARQVFIDAHYQPHSSSVRVVALAAMSLTTPTHLVLPPYTGGGGGGEELKHSTSFQGADGGCWPVTMCLCTINEEGSCAIIYLLDSFSPSIHTIVFGAQRNATTATFTEPLPLFLSHLWCGSSHFLAVTSSAFTLTRDTHDKLGVEVKVMACESNAPASTLNTVDTYTKAGWHTDTWLPLMCVHTSHTRRS